MEFLVCIFYKSRLFEVSILYLCMIYIFQPFGFASNHSHLLSLTCNSKHIWDSLIFCKSMSKFVFQTAASHFPPMTPTHIHPATVHLSSAASISAFDRAPALLSASLMAGLVWWLKRGKLWRKKWHGGCSCVTALKLVIKECTTL